MKLKSQISNNFFSVVNIYLSIYVYIIQTFLSLRSVHIPHLPHALYGYISRVLPLPI
jgi:hypothetical protein